MEFDAEQIKTRKEIVKACDDLKQLLLYKNSKYGDSAFKPLHIFSKLDAEEALRIRIDDKLSRIKQSGDFGDDEDTLMDLMGYLVLLKIARERK